MLIVKSVKEVIGFIFPSYYYNFFSVSHFKNCQNHGIKQ